jgi:hypothetical protein
MISGCAGIPLDNGKKAKMQYYKLEEATEEKIGPNLVYVLLRKNGDEYAVEKFSRDIIPVPDRNYEELLISKNFTNVSPAFIGVYNVTSEIKSKRRGTRKNYRFTCIGNSRNQNGYSPCTSKFTEPFEKKEMFDFRPCIPGADRAINCHDGKTAYSYWDYVYSLNLSEIVRAVNSNDLMRKAKAFYLESSGGNLTVNKDDAAATDED